MTTDDKHHAVTATIEQMMGATVSFEPIWSSQLGRNVGYYACVDDNVRQVQVKSPGADKSEAALELLANLRRHHPDLAEKAVHDDAGCAGLRIYTEWTLAKAAVAQLKNQEILQEMES